jgi:NAD(P)-dependent dehydrogenase (short-subunit alcohol dehydrogenase family)
MNPAPAPSASPAPSAVKSPDLVSFPDGFRALVIGASGGIGQAMVQHLTVEPRCSQVVSLHRHSEPRLDFGDETSIASAAEALRAAGKFHLIINAAGLLHSGHVMPEKKLGDLSYALLDATFRANTFGPALVLRHFTPLLDAQRGVLALLSAKVGSIDDNRLGGWYSYRASKAALNMLLKTAAIEVRRSNPQAVLVSLHPGTVNTGLSKPFKGEQIGRPAPDATCDMLNVLARLTPGDTGGFFSYTGERLPW